MRSLRFARGTPNGVSVGCNQTPSVLLPRGFGLTPPCDPGRELAPSGLPTRASLGAAAAAAASAFPRAESGRVCWRRGGSASRAAAAASESVPSLRGCRRWRASAGRAAASAPTPQLLCRLGGRPFSVAHACSPPSGGVECLLARAARAMDRGLGRTRGPEDRCPFLAFSRMLCTSSAGAERERCLASFFSASPPSGAGAGAGAGRGRLEKLCQMPLAEPGAGLSWPGRSDRGALARRTAGRGNADRRELPRAPPSGLDSERESWSRDGSNLSSHLKRGEERDRGLGEGEDARGHEFDFFLCLVGSAFEIQFDETAAFVDETEPAPLLPASRRRCVDASPSSSPLPPLLLPQPRDGGRTRSSGNDSRCEGEDSPAPLCLGGDEGVADVVAEARLHSVLLVELPSCRCRGECGRLELAERSRLRPGDVPPLDGGMARPSAVFARRTWSPKF